MKKIAVLFAGLLAAGSAAPGLSLAADAAAPVREIMKDTQTNWASDASDWIDVFEENMLGRLYSKDFSDKYKAAVQNPAADEDGISPFDYDVIVNGQDACPLQDLSIENGQPANGTTEVTVKFKAATCLEGAPNRDDFTTVRFEVIEENGKSVVDDIMVQGEEGQGPISLKATMAQIANGQ
ncbi:hypothetical protein HJB79_13070 [Rhizobium lentis]|uniref:hypothetical protein n=1 Tax=Rhizobium lentis TaxID=1138194 RepID=UPI001C83FE52|nr:hypothetical protein [Rhizobium lentis]MBX5133709.1 hypothetical protein [Rhizobium lentis]MBX5139691.1 hypothetical protein [Rhizobium lentis]MBX5150471.1 hypothetical protein [Rhizobium lentis]